MMDLPQAVQRGPGAPPDSAKTEAARYALLRRLAPSIRHHLVVNLQPISMICEVMDRRLRAPQPDLASVRDNTTKINSFARAALDSCLDVVTWLAPEERAVTTPAEGARECMGLLATSLGFRGYAIRNNVPALAGEVRRAAMRNVLTAVLIHVTDEAQAPAELDLAAQPVTTGLELALSLRPTDGAKGFVAETPYRSLDWSDVQALAQAESVQLARDGQRITLTIPWANPAPARPARP